MTVVKSSDEREVVAFMKMTLLIRVIRGVLWRLCRRTEMIVLNAPCSTIDTPTVHGFSFVRVKGIVGGYESTLIEDAMRAAGEPPGLVVPRFIHGDEFFGWVDGGSVVSFGWLTRLDRAVGGKKLATVTGRVFLYNFNTLKEYRGRGLYPALLLAIRHVLANEAVNEIVIDVNILNLSSLRGVEKAGFKPVVKIMGLILFSRWNVTLKCVALTPEVQNLFLTE